MCGQLGKLKDSWIVVRSSVRRRAFKGFTFGVFGLSPGGQNGYELGRGPRHGEGRTVAAVALRDRFRHPIRSHYGSLRQKWNRVQQEIHLHYHNHNHRETCRCGVSINYDPCHACEGSHVS
ncbi:hypothetical protein R3I94_021446 [Phoxinus phoxinus]